jgi:hypothetical protein
VRLAADTGCPIKRNRVMNLWLARFYRDLNSDDVMRRGYIRATSEADAANVAMNNMRANEKRVEVARVFVGTKDRIPEADLLNP